MVRYIVILSSLPIFFFFFFQLYVLKVLSIIVLCISLAWCTHIFFIFFCLILKHLFKMKWPHVISHIHKHFDYPHIIRSCMYVFFFFKVIVSYLLNHCWKLTPTLFRLSLKFYHIFHITRCNNGSQDASHSFKC